MGKIIICREAGMDCDFIARGQTEEEVLKKAVDHAQTGHNIEKITFEHLQTWHDIIHEE